MSVNPSERDGRKPVDVEGLLKEMRGTKRPPGERRKIKNRHRR